MVLKLTCPWLKDWNMRPGYKILTEEIQFDVGLLATRKWPCIIMILKLTYPWLKDWNMSQKNDMYPEMSEYILQKSAHLPQVFENTWSFL